MLGFNVCAADTEEEAVYLRSSSVQAILQLRQGAPGRLPPPVHDFDATLTPEQRYLIDRFSLCSAVGTRETVARSVDDFLARTGADELIIVGQIFDHQARLRSFEIVADLIGDLQPGGSSRVAGQHG